MKPMLRHQQVMSRGEEGICLLETGASWGLSPGEQHDPRDMPSYACTCKSSLHGSWINAIEERVAAHDAPQRWRRAG